MINISRESAALTTASQLIDVNGLTIECSGNLIIDNFAQQEMVAKVDFSRLSSTMDSQKLQSALSDSIKKTLDTNQNIVAEMAGPNATASDIETTKSDIITKTVSNYSMSDFTKDISETKLSQEAKFTNVKLGNKIDISQLQGFTPEQLVVILRETKSDCKLSNFFNQNMALEILSKNVSETIFNRIQSGQIDLGLDITKRTTQSVETKGLGSMFQDIFEGIGSLMPWQAMVFGAIGFIMLIVLIVIILKMGGRPRTSGVSRRFQRRPEYQGIGVRNPPPGILQPLTPQTIGYAA